MNILFTFLILGLLILIPVNVHAQVPEWVKNTSLWWAEGMISEDEFLSAIKYLLEQEIIQIDITKNHHDDELLAEAVFENEWKMMHFEKTLEFRSNMVVLLSDTAEFQSFTTMLEMKKYSNITIDDQFIKDNVVNRFQEFANFDQNVDQIRMLDLTGMEIIRIDKVNGEYVTVPDAQLQDKSGRYYFHEALKLNAGEIYLSHIDLNEEQGKVEVPHKPTIRIATQIHDSENNKLGFLIVNYNLQELFNTLSRSNHCDMVIFDEDGDVVLHPDKSKMFGNQLGHDYNYYEVHPEIEEIEEQGLDMFFDEHEQTMFVIDESEPHGSDRYWHFICELR